MTRLSIISDVHLETGNTLEEVLPTVDADIYICAGDISNKIGARPLLEALVKKGHVIYVPGNHEFYGGVFPDTYGLIDRMVEGINIHEDAQANPFKVWMLNNRMIELAGIRIIGSTLWTDYDAGNPITMLTAQRSMRDHFVIKRPDGSRFLPEDAYNAFKEATAYIESRLKLPFDGKTVVVTHHAPSFRSCSEEFYGNELNGAFHSNLEYLMRDYSPALWVHGHTHSAMDYMVCETRVVCNPYGYPHEYRLRERDYDRNKMVEI